MTLRDQGSLPLPPAVVEAAARALYARYLKEATFFQEFEEMAEGFEMEAETAVRAADKERGLQVERQEGRVSVEGQVHYPATLQRLVGPWMLVEGEPDE